MNIKKQIKEDVRGAALVYVIVTAAIIVLLGAATTATAYANLQAAQIQKHSDNNFYSADTVMNAIVGGLENDISKAYETAYTKVVTMISTYDKPEKAKQEFDSIFIEELSKTLIDHNSKQDLLYDTNYIQSYVEEVFPKNVSYTVSAIHGNNYFERSENGVVLRNLHVTYESDTGYFDEITTDVKITTPDFDPSFIPPNHPPYNAFVFDDGLEIAFGTGLEINGDTYSNERESDHSSILLKDKTSLSIITPTELIAGGLIKTENNTRLTIKGDVDGYLNKVWTENIDFGRYTQADVSGEMFVYDDAEINGSYSNIRLAGEYYGYNRNNEKANESSSINVNGAHAELNIEDLKTLVLAGSSYVSTSTTETGNSKYQNSKNLQLGEAFSVKSNQIAYLVDDKEFSEDEIEGFTSNPMSYSQYETMIAENGGWDKTVEKIANKKLSYGKSYRDYGADIIHVFSNKDNGTVYLYLNFSDPDKASKYFVDAYKGDSLLSQRLRTYAAQYINNLRLNKDTDLLVNENYIDPSVQLYTKDNLPLIEDGLGYKETEQKVTNELMDQIRTDYLGDESKDIEGQKFKVTYDKIINSEKMKEFISSATAASAYTDNNTNNKIEVIENGVIITGTSGAKAIIVDNKGKAPYEITSGKGLVVASGETRIAGDWLGTIISGGRAYCTKGTKDTPLSITVDETTVSSVFPLYFTTKTGDTEKKMSVINIFKGCENIGTNTATTEGVNADMISHCINFTNWNRD